MVGTDDYDASQGSNLAGLDYRNSKCSYDTTQNFLLTALQQVKFEDMDLNPGIIILIIIVEGFLLGYLWSRAMVRRVIAQTTRPRMVIIGVAALGSLLMLLTTLCVIFVAAFFPIPGGMYLNALIFSISIYAPALIFAIMSGLHLSPDGGSLLLQIIYQVFASIVVIVPYTVVLIALPLYLGATVGAKMAATRPLSWLAFLAPMATALVFLLAMADKDSPASVIFGILYLGMANVIFKIFGHYGALAFQVIFLTTAIPALLWLGAILGAKVATIKPWIFVMLWTSILGAFVFFLNRNLDPNLALYSIGVTIYSGFSL